MKNTAFDGCQFREEVLESIICNVETFPNFIYSKRFKNKYYGYSNPRNHSNSRKNTVVIIIFKRCPDWVSESVKSVTAIVWTWGSCDKNVTDRSCSFLYSFIYYHLKFKSGETCIIYFFFLLCVLISF